MREFRASLSGDILLSFLVMDLKRRSHNPGAFYSQNSLIITGSYSGASGLLS